MFIRFSSHTGKAEMFYDVELDGKHYLVNKYNSVTRVYLSRPGQGFAGASQHICRVRVKPGSRIYNAVMTAYQQQARRKEKC